VHSLIHTVHDWQDLLGALLGGLLGVLGAAIVARSLIMSAPAPTQIAEHRQVPQEDAVAYSKTHLPPAYTAS